MTVPTFVSFSFPPKLQLIFVVVCTVTWLGSSAISLFFNVVSKVTSNCYLNNFAFYGLVADKS